MSAQVHPEICKTAKPIVAGVLNIVVGSFYLLGVLGLGIAAAVVSPVLWGITFIPSAILVLIAIPIAALGVLSIVGGIFDLERRMWGWALAGSIASVMVSHVLGIASVILTAISKDEFN